MSLDPKITPPNNRGDQYLTWTPDPTAEGYSFTTPGGNSRTFNPSLSRTKIGRNLAQPILVTISALDVIARPAEQTTYPTTSSSTAYGRLLYGTGVYGH